MIELCWRKTESDMTSGAEDGFALTRSGIYSGLEVVLQYREVDISSGRKRAVTDWIDVEISDE